jgi:hypothetical protein
MSTTPCPPSTSVTPGVVVFDPAAFKTAFPSFATLADAALSMAFQLATLQLNNSCGSRVCDAPTRELLLNLLVAHIAALTYGENGNPPSGLVGRVNHAQEGSVSVGTDFGTMDRGQAYYAQTQWGAMFWQSTARFRTMVYIPAPIVCADVPYPGAYFGGYWGGGDGGCGC